MSTKVNHTHKLKRHVYNTGAKTYFCVLDCTFRVACELALGKKCICWRCGEEFSLNSYSITLAKPHCEKCHIHKTNSDKLKQIVTVETVSASIGTAVVESLSERLKRLSQGISDSPVATKEEKKPSTDVTQYKQYKDDEDDIL